MRLLQTFVVLLLPRAAAARRLTNLRSAYGSRADECRTRARSRGRSLDEAHAPNNSVTRLLGTGRLRVAAVEHYDDRRVVSTSGGDDDGHSARVFELLAAIAVVERRAFAGSVEWSRRQPSATMWRRVSPLARAACRRLQASERSAVARRCGYRQSPLISDCFARRRFYALAVWPPPPSWRRPLLRSRQHLTAFASSCMWRRRRWSAVVAAARVWPSSGRRRQQTRALQFLASSPRSVGLQHSTAIEARRSHAVASRLALVMTGSYDRQRAGRQRARG